MKKPTLQMEKLTDPKSIHAYYQKIIHCMPNNVYWLDRDCITQGCNDNTLKLVGLTSYNQFIGITYEEMGQLAGWTEDQAASFKQDDMEVISTGIAKLNIEEPPLYDKQGHPIYYLSSRVPIFNEDHDEVIGVVGISVDITDRKKMEADMLKALEIAETANRAKNAFIMNMAHDIRTPLSGMILMAEELANRATADTVALEYAQLLVQSAKRLHELLEGVLELSKAEQINEQEIKKEAVDLRQLIDNLRSLLLPAIKTRGLTLNTDIDSATPQWVTSDRLKLERILLNLTTNAIKFTEKGQITLACHGEPSAAHRVKLKIAISDTGIGISADQFEAIFDRFVKVHPSYQGIYKGHGVGLFIVKKYVTLLGGIITVDSTVGQGTTFTIQLDLPISRATPLDKPEASDPILPAINPPETLTMSAINVAANPPAMPIKQSAGLSQILLIEDDPAARLGAQARLEKAGYQVTTAATMTDALARLQQQRFQLVITDIGLPDGDGSELTKQYRAWEQQNGWQRIPFIALTGHGSEEVKTQLLAAGIDDIWTKPPTPEHIQLLATLLHKEKLPLFDKTMVSVGKTELTTLVQTCLGYWPEELAILKQAQAEQDWEKIAFYVLKLKGSSLYVAASRLHQACITLETALVTNSPRRKDLLEQLVQVLDETLQALTAWLQKP